ncbi:MAG: WXG100 family type VII secretion target [Acidimicrobiaceae bacterium]|nr:WXG100 family type VII secretion target [Acidimicrobiaceae bacterium]
MSDLQADYAALDRASRLIGQIREGILREQTRVDAEVDCLLAAGWTGQAAGQFAQAWHEWCLGMSEVLEALGLESAAIALTRAELEGSDAEIATAAARLDGAVGTVGEASA